MHLRFITPITTALVLLTGCAATIGQEGLEQRTALAIGRSVGQFTLSDKSEETGGRINYLVNTRDGMTYSCYLYGVTGFQKAMSFGQTPHSDAVCTSKVSASGQSRGGNQGPAAAGKPASRAGETCNALHRAAGRC
jgi:hypothetical protein